MYSGGLNTVRDVSQWESLSCLVRSGTTGGTLGAEGKINAELSGYKMGFLSSLTYVIALFHHPRVSCV